MNQILSIENNNKKEKKKKNKRASGPIEIHSILKFFAITMLIFGFCMIGTGSYSMYKDSKEIVATSKPTIYVEGTSEKEITLKVSHNKNLSKVTYSWTGQSVNEIPCDGKKTVEQKIDIPTGTNTLTVYAIDVDGQEINYQKTYTLQGDITIDFEASGNNIKVTAEGKNELKFMTYRWDEDEETKIDINDMQTEQNIEIPKGLHTLTVIVVDSNNTQETKIQEVNGVTKPKLEITTDGSDNFIIKASDEQGLQKIEFIIYGEDGTEKNRLTLDGRTELEYAYPLHDGENKLEVTVYNVNDVSETSRVKLTK